MCGNTLSGPVPISLGRPLPYQLANRTQTPPSAATLAGPSLSPCTMRYKVSCGISTPFGALSPTNGQVVCALLTLSPLYSPIETGFLVRLACLNHAASVRSEPVSYPSIKRSDTCRKHPRASCGFASQTSRTGMPTTCGRLSTPSWTSNTSPRHRLLNCQRAFQGDTFPPAPRGCLHPLHS